MESVYIKNIFYIKVLYIKNLAFAAREENVYYVFTQ